MVLPPRYTMRAETSDVELTKVSKTCRSGSAVTANLNLHMYCLCAVCCVGSGTQEYISTLVYWNMQRICIYICTMQPIAYRIQYDCLLSVIKVMAWPPHYTVSMAWTRSMHWKEGCIVGGILHLWLWLYNL